MFQTAVHEAFKKQASLKTEAEARAAGALDTASKLSEVLTDSLNEEVREIYETQKILEAESQLLRRELAEARATISAWREKLTVLQDALKQAGDLEHYVEHLGREAALIARVSADLGLCRAASRGESLGGAAAAAAAAPAAGGGGAPAARGAGAGCGGGGSGGAEGGPLSSEEQGGNGGNGPALPLSVPVSLPLSRGASR